MRTSSVADVVTKAHLGAVFTRHEALAAGVTPAQLRGPGVHTVFRGVFTIADPAGLSTRARAALALAGPQALVCGTTALALLGVALPDARPTQTVHVWVPPSRGLITVPGICGHRDTLSLRPKQVMSGIVAVNPAECWLQAAQATSVADLVVLADGLTRRRDPLLELDDLREVLEGAAGRRGVRAARAALALAREGTDSPMETVLRLALVGSGLPCPIVNHPLRGPRGGVLYFLDMAYPDALVGVEYDGAGHVGNPAQMRRDQARRRWIEDRGWRLITATAIDLADPSGIVGSVRRALDGRRPAA
ncbi:MAG: hypothetical protein FWC46_01905 [Actinomycetia bacterium]|nr:hypothetical protein [Actinomycetes bacterium]